MRPGSASSVAKLDDDGIENLISEGLARCPEHLRREGEKVRYELLWGDRMKAIRDLLIWRVKLGGI
jgi:hypothetical protein